MKRILKIASMVFLLMSIVDLSAQQWTPPKPLMTKIILKSFLDMHLEYPLQARQNKEEGNVVIGFSIDKKGKIESRHIKKSVSAAVDSCALKLFDLIIWKPAEKYGKAVACSFDENSGFLISFNVRRYSKLIKKRGYDELSRNDLPVDSTLKVYKRGQLKQAPTFVNDAAYNSLNEFIYQHIVYPEEAIRLNISGIVRLCFIIETNGLVSNLVVEETVGGGCTEEAIGVVQKIKWNPGRLNGLAVRTQTELEIIFKNPAHLKNKHIPNQQNSGL